MMNFKYLGRPVVVLGYMGERILIRLPNGIVGWVAADFVK